MMHFGMDPRKNRSRNARCPRVQSCSMPRIPAPGAAAKGPRVQAAALWAGDTTRHIGADSSTFEVEQRYEVIENMLHNLKLHPLHLAIEQALNQLLNATSCVFWLDNRVQNVLSSSTLSRDCAYHCGLVGKAYRERVVVNAVVPSADTSYDCSVDSGDASTIYLPLFNNNNIIIGVAQIMRIAGWLPFAAEDRPKAVFFQQNIKRLSHLVLPEADHLVHSIAQNPLSTGVLSQLQSRLVRHFKCRVVEFWKFDAAHQAVFRYVESGGWLQQSAKQLGVAGHAVKSASVVQLENVTKGPGWSPDVDGRQPEPILVVPFAATPQTVAVAVRGKCNNQPLSTVDRMQLESVTPMIARVLSGGTITTDDAVGNDFALRLKALLEVAEILSGVLDIDVLVPTIMSRACELLRTERCSLFLVDTGKQELVSRFHGGLDKSLRLPMNRGVVGHTATTGNIVNITDAYSDPRFDKRVDKETGFKTRSLLTVPIYNNRGEIAGVTEMINRVDGSAFDDDDIKMMLAFNVFCGISLDNAKLYTTSLDLTRQLRGFVEMTTALNKTKTVRDVIEGILTNAMMVIHASRATVFLFDKETGELTQFVNIGGSVIHGTEFAMEVMRERTARLFEKDDIIKKLDARKAPKESGGVRRQSSRVSLAFDLESAHPLIPDPQAPDAMALPVGPICGFPLVNDKAEVLGVMELSCSWRILPEDLKLLDCFAVFAAVSLEKSELQDFATYGVVEKTLKKYIADGERKSSKVPARLTIPAGDATSIFTVNFDAPAWDGIGFFKILWAMFNRFNLLEEFRVSNECFFRFISSISSTYKKVPYHNWRHAVDVTQFVTFEVLTGSLHIVLPKFELFGLLVAAVCHDANHDGFTNVYNVKAETPLGILFKNQSVMETHHCSVSIQCMASHECNMFSSLASGEFKAIWTLIIQLILTTDMAKHFEFLKMANAVMDKGPLDMNNQEHRIILLQLILKCGDVSNVSRPFELADKWCDVLCEEFFRQGDLEMAQGMEYTSPLNDREHLDKPKSQIGFYTFVCLPLYETCSRAVKPLVCNCNQIKENLAVWKAAAAAKEGAAGQK